MNSYIEESAASYMSSVQTAFITLIDAYTLQASNETERQKWQNLKSKFLSDGTALATSIAAFLEEHYKSIGHEIPNTIKFLSKGDAISVSVDLINGEDVLNAVVKGVLDTGTGRVSGLIGSAALAFLAPEAGAFAIAATGIVVGFIAAKAVGDYIKNGVDYVVGVTDKKSPIDGSSGVLIEVLSANLYNTLHEHYDTLKTISHWKIILDAEPGTSIEYQNNTYGFTQSLFDLKRDGSNLEVLLKYVDVPTFKLKTTSGTYELTNLMHKTEGQLASLAKSDTDALSALIGLKSYMVDEYHDYVNPEEYSNSYINDRAKMLYWYNMSKWHNLGMTAVDRELSRYDLHFSDMHNDIEFGGHDLIFDYGKKITFGTFGSDTIEGGELDDKLYGDDGTDTLIGNGGKDWLEGGKGNDVMQGGADFDTYISGNMDVISDSDGKGRVYFEGKLLTGGTKPAGSGCGTGPDGSDEYYGDGGVYRLSGSTLTFIKDGKILTFEDYIKNDLSITLKDNQADNGACPPPAPGNGGSAAPCPKPVTPSFNLNFSLPTPTISYGGGGGGGGGSWGGGGGGGGGGYSGGVSTPHRTPTPPAPKVVCINYPNYSSAGAGGGSSTSPIVLDLNRDGITSISLAASKALFDYDGDGVKENTAWIEGGDALLVNDVNGDGIINNASELFGNYTKNSDGSIAKSGYQALSYYDSNSDGIIDVTDTRFSELSLWIDSNSDGITDSGELKTLTEMGVTSLALNSTTPYMATPENNNTIIQETAFTDANGEGVMRDVLFRYENTDTPTDGVYFDMDANGFKEKMLTWTNPNEWMIVKDINGDGKINNGSEVVGNNMILSNGTTASDTIQALKTFDINHDGKITTADNSGLAFWTDRNHNGITDVGELEALGAAGAIQVVYFRDQKKVA